MACPWSGWAPSVSQFCEAPLCAWVREPGNTASNAGFALVAIWMFLRARDPRRRHLRPLAWATLATGVGSAFYHATDTRAGEVLDYAGMHLAAALMIGVCLRRLTGWSRARLVPIGAALFAIGVASVAGPGNLQRWVYLVEGVACFSLEVSMMFGPKRAASYRWWLVWWLFFVPAMTAWTLDQNGTWCDPGSHVFSGHAAWHLLNALGYGVLFLYYEQFDTLRTL